MKRGGLWVHTMWEPTCRPAIVYIATIVRTSVIFFGVSVVEGEINQSINKSMDRWEEWSIADEGGVKRTGLGFDVFCG